MTKNTNIKYIVIITVLMVVGVGAGYIYTNKTSLPGKETSLPRPTNMPPKAVFYVDIKDGKFLPDKITVPVNSRVFWKNLDEKLNSVNTMGKEGEAGYLYTLDSPEMEKDESFSCQFDKKGTYKYFNKSGSKGQGRVEVR